MPGPTNTVIQILNSATATPADKIKIAELINNLDRDFGLFDINLAATTTAEAAREQKREEEKHIVATMSPGNKQIPEQDELGRKTADFKIAKAAFDGYMKIKHPKATEVLGKENYDVDDIKILKKVANDPTAVHLAANAVATNKTLVAEKTGTERFTTLSSKEQRERTDLIAERANAEKLVQAAKKETVLEQIRTDEPTQAAAQEKRMTAIEKLEAARRAKDEEMRKNIAAERSDRLEKEETPMKGMLSSKEQGEQTALIAERADAEKLAQAAKKETVLEQIRTDEPTQAAAQEKRMTAIEKLEAARRAKDEEVRKNIAAERSDRLEKEKMTTKSEDKEKTTTKGMDTIVGNAAEGLKKNVIGSENNKGITSQFTPRSPEIATPDKQRGG